MTPRLGIALTALIMAAACRPGIRGPERPPAGEIRAVVTWVTDGDTLRVSSNDGEATVRLIGVNAPDDGECLHGESTRFLRDAVEGMEIALVAHDTDQFGRTLAYVWKDGESVNLSLVSGGWAIATTPTRDDPTGQGMIAAEELAYQRHSGLWDPASCGSGRLPHLVLHVEPDPPGPDEDFLAEEQVTVSNDSGRPVDLGGWVIRDESSAHRYTFPLGTSLLPGQSLAISSSDEGWSPGGLPIWNNVGDMALLLDPNGAVAARVRY